MDCILCGRCLSVCPVVAVTNREELSPRSKGFLARSLIEGTGDLELKKVRKLSELCAGCDRCSRVCPQGLDLPEIISGIKSRCPGWKDWTTSAMFSSAGTSLWKMGAVLADAVGRKEGAIHTVLQPWLRVIPSPGSGLDRAVLFPGCTALHVQKRWNETAETLLKAQGIHVLTSDTWSCCGFALRRAGLSEEENTCMTNNLNVWRESGRPPLVAFCATCLSGLSGYVSQELGWEKGEKEMWLSSLKNLNSMLCIEDVELSSTAPHAVVAHMPCHQDGAPDWVSLIKGKVDVTLSDACCGFGGQLQIVNRSLSRKIADTVWKSVDCRTDTCVLTSCSGCALQFKMTAPSGCRAGHWLEIVYF